MISPSHKGTLRVALLTTRDGLYGVHHLLKHLNVVGVVIDRGSPRKAAVAPAGAGAEAAVPLWERIQHARLRGGYRGVATAMGRKLLPYLPEFLARSDRMALAARSERRHLRTLDRLFLGYRYHERHLENRDFVGWQEVTRYYQAPVIEVDNINGDDAAAALTSWKPDLGVIVGGRIVKPHIIGIPTLGILNKHSSILPRHRGLSAEYWCLFYEDFASLGVTVHYVEPGLDNGPILVQRAMTFHKGDTPESLRFRSNMVGRAAIVDAVRLIENTRTRGIRQDEAQATRNSRPTAESDRVLYAKLPSLWQKYGV
jgi:folate-dependent phosphoribosylglycinamide formyltransferase PurN